MKKYDYLLSFIVGAAITYCFTAYSQTSFIKVNAKMQKVALGRDSYIKNCNVFSSQNKLNLLGTWVSKEMAAAVMETVKLLLEAAACEAMPQGHRMLMNSNGKIKSIGQYNAGVKTGKWMHFNKKGKCHLVENL